MALTPSDIQQKTFGPELRGYNMDEVDDFLDDIVNSFKDHEQRMRDAQDRIAALEAEVSTRGEDESAISRALVAAQKQADSMIAEAQTAADRIRTEAETEISQYHEQQEHERLGHTQEIARMRAIVGDLRRRVTELAGSVSDDLDRIDAAASTATDDLGPGLVGNNDLADDRDDEGAYGAFVDPQLGFAADDATEAWDDADADSTEAEDADGIESDGGGDDVGGHEGMNDDADDADDTDDTDEFTMPLADDDTDDTDDTNNTDEFDEWTSDEDAELVTDEDDESSIPRPWERS